MHATAKLTQNLAFPIDDMSCLQLEMVSAEFTADLRPSLVR